jgi:hypothetical protein
MIVQRDVERHRDHRREDTEDGAGQQVPAAGLVKLNSGDDTQRRGKHGCTEVHQEERWARVRLGVDTSHRSDCLNGTGAIQSAHDEGREHVHHSGSGGVDDRRDDDQDDNEADVHDW